MTNPKIDSGNEQLVQDLERDRLLAIQGDHAALGRLLVLKLCFDMYPTSKQLNQLLTEFCNDIVETAKISHTVN